MKKLIALIALLLSIGIFAREGLPAEIVRQKNAATYVVFPIVKNDGTLISSATGLDSEIDTWADGSAPDGFADCTNEATEIGSTGQYYLSLTQSEMNVDYAIVQIKSTSTDSMVQTLLIRTMVGDPLLLATTDDGGTINVTSGKIDEVATLTGHTAQTGDSYAIVNNGTYGNNALKTLIDAILADTGELQTNQGNWLTATGFSTFNPATDEVDIGEVKGVAVTGVADFKATGYSTHSAADVWAVATRTISAFSFNVGLSAAAVDDIWDELLADHTDAGSSGKKLGDLPTSGTGDWTAGEKADILEALSVDDGSVGTEEDLEGILDRVKKSRGR